MDLSKCIFGCFHFEQVRSQEVIKWFWRNHDRITERRNEESKAGAMTLILVLQSCKHTELFDIDEKLVDESESRFELIRLKQQHRKKKKKLKSERSGTHTGHSENIP